MKRVPLTEPLEASTSINARPEPKKSVDVTTLTNGLRVISTEATLPVTSIGVFTDVGSRHESDSNAGITSFLDKMMFKSNGSQREFDVTRQSHSLGATLTASTTREHQFLVGDCLPEHTERILETFANAIQDHQFNPLEVEAAAKQYGEDLKERETNMEGVILDLVHEAAYMGNTLGRPIHAKQSQLHKFDSQSLKDWQRSYYTPKRMIIGGVGVDHDTFVKQVSQHFDNLPREKIALDSVEKARYTGGELKVHSSKDEQTHLAIAFETASWHHKDVVAMCVLQILMGGGGSFSAGGPGKGMYSRLYRNVLNQHHFFENATCFNSIFNDSGLFGVYGVSTADHGTAMAEVLVGELIKMTSEIEQVELDRAKNQLKSSVYMQLETRSLMLEDICRQLAVFGKYETAETVVGWVDQVTVADVHRVAGAMLRTPPTVAAAGDLRYVPRTDQIAQAIAAHIS